jgi:hypothetical protein
MEEEDTKDDDGVSVSGKSIFTAAERTGKLGITVDAGTPLQIP